MHTAWRPSAGPGDVARWIEIVFSIVFGMVNVNVMNTLQVKSTTRRLRLRFCLGMLQMAGAVIAVVLLLATGVTTVSLLAVVLTSVASSISVLLFGNRRENGARKNH
jgi:hypothetical protein